MFALHVAFARVDGVEDAAADRWAQYAASLLSVEVEPDRWVDLTGPAAVDTLPFDDTFFLITACDPFGAERSPEENADANDRLAARLDELGATRIAAIGRDPDGPHAEPGFAVRGLDRGALRAVGREFDQEAVFEIDATGIRMVACFDEQVVEVRVE